MRLHNKSKEMRFFIAFFLSIKNAVLWFKNFEAKKVRRKTINIINLPLFHLIIPFPIRKFYFAILYSFLSIFYDRLIVDS